MGDPKNKGAEARARYAAQRGVAASYRDAEFINVNLNDGEETAMRAWCDNHTLLLQLMHEEIENGYKFTLKWDARGDCSACFMQHSESGSINGGYILTGRAGTVSGALRECLFIHREILHGEWEASASRGRKNLSDDDF